MSTALVVLLLLLLLLLFVVCLFMSLYLDQLLSSYVVEKGRRRVRKEQRRRRSRRKRKKRQEDAVSCNKKSKSSLHSVCTASLCSERVSCHSARRQVYLLHQGARERGEEEDQQRPGWELQRKREQTEEKVRVSFWLVSDGIFVVIHCPTQWC